MEKMERETSAFFYFLCTLIFLSAPPITAQSATTDPTEVRALNSLFEQWNTKAVEGLWNISGEPCTGSAVNGTDFEDRMNNPAIKCDCSYDSGTTCHITQLRVYASDKTGTIPQILTDLKYLKLLNIDQNYFTGPLPAFIGNLTALTKLSIAHNAFYGSIPKEIGNLRELRELSIGVNNFSGTLPPEIGNLVNLEQIYINSCGLGGEIPSTFANLTSMTVLWASDSPFSGKIPDFIGNWTMLRNLRFQGNSFEGPIPSSFSNLTSLETLRISDLYNVSSTLDFLKNSKNLTDLDLRNALISGPIPSEIGQLVKLQKLDLSFNNLTGQIPSFLFNNMTSLVSLFLGNNSLSGTIPNQKSDVLQNIDLSYNYLSGSFPSWVTSDLQLNLVANNFIFDNSNISIFPGLNCLQRNFPCHRDVPVYANFSIKCGGEEMTTASGIIFEAENASLGPASMFISSGDKWAVSNVGLYADRTSPSYIANSLAQVTNTDIPELYQKSRLSPNSLRYYGLGLQNGNYTVTLYFAETAFPDPSTLTWQSHGRRVFNVYIQGKLELKDFDISKAAGGVERAITMNFNASVSDGHLEIHLFWAGKGTCCTPVQGYYGPIISALSAIPADFTPSVTGLPPPGNRKDKSKTGLIVGVTVSVAVASLILLFAILYLRRKTSKEDDEAFLGLGPIPNTFSYAELRTATGDFNLSNKLGEGGFGPVYKGTLSDGRQVAVKQLSVASNQGTTQFIAEIAAISAVQHRNLVKLYGICIEGNRRLLVYEYLENKSLDKALFGRDRLHLDWPTRFKICLATAKGLAYLHEESRPRIVHRDVKASNILLDVELSPKISDFGLAKLYDDKKTHISTGIAGTIGYLAPEYAMRGHLTEKADVFSFGVLALEILSGRRNSDNSLADQQVYLLEWTWNLHEKNRSLALVDENLTSFDEEEVVRVVRVALLCTQGSPMMRPAMSRVVGMLSGDIEVNTVISKPSYLTDWDFEDLSTDVSNQNTSSFENEKKKKNGSRDEEDDTSIDLNPNRGGVEAVHSPLNMTQPRLSDLIGQGR